MDQYSLFGYSPYGYGFGGFNPYMGYGGMGGGMFNPYMGGGFGGSLYDDLFSSFQTKLDDLFKGYQEKLNTGAVVQPAVTAENSATPSTTQTASATATKPAGFQVGYSAGGGSKFGSQAEKQTAYNALDPRLQQKVQAGNVSVAKAQELNKALGAGMQTAQAFNNANVPGVQKTNNLPMNNPRKV